MGRALGAQGAAHDALTYRVLIWAMEAASLELLNASDPLELPRVKRVLGDLLVGDALSQHPGSDETARVTAGQSPLAPTEPRLGSHPAVAML